jgi:hypothetical protein
LGSCLIGTPGGALPILAEIYHGFSQYLDENVMILPQNRPQPFPINDSFNSSAYEVEDGGIMKCEMQRKWKEAVVA